MDARGAVRIPCPKPRTCTGTVQVVKREWRVCAREDVGCAKASLNARGGGRWEKTGDRRDRDTRVKDPALL